MAPLPPGPRRTRLAGLGSSNPNAPKAKKPPPKPTCCDDPKIEDEDGAKVCVNCGTQISESNIVADVTFQEDSRGAATVQGGFIGENSRHARTLGSAAFRKIGGGERNSTQEIENTGRRYLNAMCPRLGVPDNVMIQAQSLFTMAANFNFNAGRKTEEVVAVCLYIACRRQKGNNVLLMDIAELLKVNVFRLGEVYKDLCKTSHYYEQNVGVQPIIDIEPLIKKYCKKLEFGEMHEVVALDAVRILKRMNRDWMVTGRHPAGLCGACIILAARMNNFRRSVREVVLVAKVADITISSRIEEFRRTKASTLTVDQFREFGVRLQYKTEPPIMQKTREKEKKLEEARLEREAQAVDRENGVPPPGQNNEQDGTITISDDEDEDDSSSDSASQSGTPAPDGVEDGGRRRKRQRTAGPEASQQEPRFDEDGFAIPARPVIDPALTGDTEPPAQQQPPNPKKRGRGRPRKPQRPEPVRIQITEEELATEDEIDKEIKAALDDEELAKAEKEAQDAHKADRVERAGEFARVIATQETHLSAERSKERREAQGINWWKDKEAGLGETVTAAELEAEFADDPEVLNCLLTENEASLKEQIWVAHNEDWLRSQHEKYILKQMAELSGKNKDKGRGGKGGKRKKRSKMGDRSVLEDAETPINTPADATTAMLKKRGPAGFSKYVDYERLARVYNHNNTPPTSTSQSREGSETPSSRAASVAPSAVSGADGAAASPVPRRTVHFGLQSPQATQRVDANAASASRSTQPATSDDQAPMSPPATQSQATAGAEDVEQEEDEGMNADDDYQSEAEEFAPGGWGDEDDREDIGYDDEGDYNRAIDRAAADDYGTYGDDDAYM